MLAYPSTANLILDRAVADPVVSKSDAELRAHLERILDGQYDLGAEVGRGGMGVVYKARDHRLKRSVAVKVLPPELGYRAEIRTRFLREAEMAAQLSHPNIVPIYTVDEKEGLVYFAMAFVEGENLGHLIQRGGGMDPEVVRRVLREVADALSYAHGMQVVHRDIKPDNILLDAVTGRSMVTDFGIARAITEGADSRLTATGVAIGTPAYMSPEQSAGDKEIDGRSDLYSLGVVAYQMLAGELPFVASSTPAMLVKHLSEDPTPISAKCPGIPADLAAVVMCMLAKDPADRFPDANALVAALDGAGPVPARRPRAARPAQTWSPVPEYPSGEVDAVDIARWNAPVVVAFRRRLPPFIAVNSAILALSVFTSTDLLQVTAFWSVYLSYKYAGVWRAGYDWRDVFRQPHDRLLFDVVAEWIDDVRGLFDHEKRAEVRARWKARRRKPGLMVPPPVRIARPRTASGAAIPGLGSARSDMVRQASLDREEIEGLLESLPDRERKALANVNAAAKGLAECVRGLALTLAALERTAPAEGDQALEVEIERLEEQANPLDRDASEARVRRLAVLKRDRRRLAESRRQRDEVEGKLESCALALQNLRFDVVRLSSGSATADNVTLVAQQAVSLANDADELILASPDQSAGKGRKGHGR